MRELSSVKFSKIGNLKLRCVLNHIAVSYKCVVHIVIAYENIIEKFVFSIINHFLIARKSWGIFIDLSLTRTDQLENTSPIFASCEVELMTTEQ